MKPSRFFSSFFTTAVVIGLLTGCQSPKENAPASPVGTTPAQPAATTAASTPATTPASSAAPFAAVRIKAGPGESFKDAEGNVWLSEQGFADGETTERPELKIENTKTPAIYLSEKYSMTFFTYPVPNGKYTIKLHFCETYEGITGPGERVFSFNVQGHEFKDFDIWAKSGGFLRPCIITVPIDVTDGKVKITFTPQVENPQINGIEILPGN